MLFLRLLEVPGPQRSGRRTRDGRTPFIAQEKLAARFKMPQPDISRIEKYWLEGDGANLLSLKTAEVLTGELMARMVVVFVPFPWWGVNRVYQYLRVFHGAVAPSVGSRNSRKCHCEERILRRSSPLVASEEIASPSARNDRQVSE